MYLSAIIVPGAVVILWTSSIPEQFYLHHVPYEIFNRWAYYWDKTSIIYLISVKNIN